MDLLVDDRRRRTAGRCRLNICRAGLLLEDGVVAQALAFGLLAIATRWLTFVALCEYFVSKLI